MEVEKTYIQAGDCFPTQYGLGVTSERETTFSDTETSRPARHRPDSHKMFHDSDS